MVVVAVNMVLVVVVGYLWWRSGGCSGGDSLCKGSNCNKCRSALVKEVVVMVPGGGDCYDGGVGGGGGDGGGGCGQEKSHNNNY